MKRICLLCVALAWALSAMAKSDEKKDEPKTGDTTVIAYEGRQSWPTSKTAEVIQDYAVPIYKGLPDKAYKVIGRVVDERQEGIEEVGRAFDDAFASRKQRLRVCANQAKLHGGNAVMITDDERVLKALNLTTKDAKKEAPLVHERHSVVLIIKL
ncbi:MAG TPA: hypothetical protein VL486_10490 [Verrucomicrobiae bacterium]|nr:hypothetical protein [Verrucomicrobiae bacterium]